MFIQNLGLSMTTSTHVAAMDRLIDRIDRLHSAPHVVCQVLRLLQDEDYQTNELVGCLQADPALASSVLRLVNSSYFGLARHVGSLQHAVTFLGSRSLRLAVLSFGLLKQLVRDTPARVYQDFWRRSLTMASVGSRLAARQTSSAGTKRIAPDYWRISACWCWPKWTPRATSSCTRRSATRSC